MTSIPPNSRNSDTLGTITTDGLNDQQRLRLRALAGLIVPASSEYRVPGADDDTIFADILASSPEVLDLLKQALAFAEREVEDWSQAAAVLEGRVEMAPLVTLVLQCYYRDDRVMQSLGMEPRPPFPQGYAVPEGDWSLLEPVQRRGKLWRDA